MTIILSFNRTFRYRLTEKEFLKRMGIEKPEGLAYADLPIAGIDPDVWTPEFRMLGRKLFLALYYQTFGTVLPMAGGLWFQVQSNADRPDPEFIDAIRQLGGQALAPMRSRQPLADQFGISWSAATGPNVALYLVGLQQMIYFSGFAVEDAAPIVAAGIPLECPFEWGDIAAIV